MQSTDTTVTPLADDYDVVVVGARAAGAATAMNLARAGLRVAAIDKANYGSDTLSTHSIARAGVLLLSRWGVLDELRAAGTPRADRIAFTYGDDVVAMDIPADGDVDGLYSPRRTRLDRTLVDAAADAGATVRHGTAVTRVVKTERGRVCGVEVDDGGALRTIKARYVVGADGMRSRVADQVGAVMLREEVGGSGVIYAYYAGVDQPEFIENEFRPGHAAGVIPTDDGETCVWVGVPGAQFRAWVADGVDAAFERSVAASPMLQRRLNGATATTGFRSFPGRAGFLRQSWGDGWALAGDSGYYKDPISAHGITDALIGAEVLSGALVTALTGDGLDIVALSRYQQIRNRLAAPMVAAVARAASFPADMAEMADAYRAMSGAMRLEWDFLEERFTRQTALAA